MKAIFIIALLAAIAIAGSLSSCAFRLGADGSKEVSVDAAAAPAALTVIKILAEK